MKTRNHPGIYVPPPLIYAAVFGLSFIIQHFLPIRGLFMTSSVIRLTGWILICINLIFTVLALRKFWLTKNTLITAKPARSLQTSGIYSLTRNPMYLGLLLLYTGFSCFTNNCWTLILLPLLFIIIQEYVIKREENYLDRAFAEKYNEYKRKVRRWI